jgi:hypothetical protein
MSNMCETLPVEVWEHILSFLPHITDDPQPLLNARLVSRLLYDAVNSRLHLHLISFTAIVCVDDGVDIQQARNAGETDRFWMIPLQYDSHAGGTIHFSGTLVYRFDGIGGSIREQILNWARRKQVFYRSQQDEPKPQLRFEWWNGRRHASIPYVANIVLLENDTQRNHLRPLFHWHKDAPFGTNHLPRLIFQQSKESLEPIHVTTFAPGFADWALGYNLVKPVVDSKLSLLGETRLEKFTLDIATRLVLSEDSQPIVSSQHDAEWKCRYPAIPKSLMSRCMDIAKTRNIPLEDWMQHNLVTCTHHFIDNPSRYDANPVPHLCKASQEFSKWVGENYPASLKVVTDAEIVQVLQHCHSLSLGQPERRCAVM